MLAVAKKGRTDLGCVETGRCRACQRDAGDWQVVAIDLRKLAAGYDFMLPVEIEANDSPAAPCS